MKKIRGTIHAFTGNALYRTDNTQTDDFTFYSFRPPFIQLLSEKTGELSLKTKKRIIPPFILLVELILVDPEVGFMGAFFLQQLYPQRIKFFFRGYYKR
jgi:hypothetical protein